MPSRKRQLAAIQKRTDRKEVEYIQGLSEKVRKHYQDYPDLELAYELDDPKHPTYMARLIERVDRNEV